MNNDFNKIEIKENLTLDEIYALNSLNINFDSFLIEDNSKRSYLDSESFAHLIGYTGFKDNPKSKNTKPKDISGLELNSIIF